MTLRGRAAAARGIALLVLATACAGIQARQPGASECIEAGDFIRNAALARDGGMREEEFVGRVRDDIELIQAYPPQMRWFVQDDDDAAFLIGAVTDVFRNPRPAAQHQSDFVRACLDKKHGGQPNRV